MGHEASKNKQFSSLQDLALNAETADCPPDQFFNTFLPWQKRRLKLLFFLFVAFMLPLP
jgi:hypothetical protein